MSSLHVSFWVRGGDEEVVHVDDKPSLSDHIVEGVIHELLEYSGGGAKAKEHDGRFKKSFMDDESCLPLVTILNADIVVSPINIKLGEVVSIFQLVH